MADYSGQQTAGTVIKSVAPALNAVPYVGGLLSMAATIGGGALEADAAKKQAAQAEKIRQDALRLKTQPLRPEFQQKKNMDMAAYLAGFPGYEQMKLALGEDLANSIRSIHESSPSGAAAVTAIAAVQRQKEKAMTDLGVKNAMFKTDALNQLGNTVWNIGEKQRQLEDIRDKQKAEGLTAANAFDAAATYNKMGGINKILGAVGSTATSLTKNYIDPNTAYGVPTTATSTGTAQSSGYGEFTEYQNGITLPATTNTLGALNYPMQIGEPTPLYIP